MGFLVHTITKNQAILIQWRKDTSGKPSIETLDPLEKV